MIIDIQAPAVGESIGDAVISSIYVKVGDIVKKDQVLLEYETEKATLELTAPSAGVVIEMLVQKGDNVQLGAILLRIDQNLDAKVAQSSSQNLKNEQVASVDTANDAASIQGKPQDKEDNHEAYTGGTLGGDGLTPEDKIKIQTLPLKAEKDFTFVNSIINKNQASNDAQTSTEARAMPAAQRFANDHDIDLSHVHGTGLGQRITKANVIDFNDSQKSAGQLNIKSNVSSNSNVASNESREKIVKMTKMRQTIATRLKESQNTAAMLTTFNEVDMSSVMSFRKKYQDTFTKRYGVKLGMMSFFVKAAIHALQSFQIVNASVDKDNIIYKYYYNIGVAIGLDSGLVVPVLRDADKMSFNEIESTIIDFANQARDGKLQPAAMSGGTFTITNGGTYGSLLSTPIINPPQSAILGMHNIVNRPVAIGDKIEIRPMMYLALSYDHRIIDGKDAVQFLGTICNAIADPSSLLLAM